MANTLNTIFKATPLTVADIQNPAADYYIIKLNYATDRHFDWKPGTAGLFTLPHQKIQVAASASSRLRAYLTNMPLPSAQEPGKQRVHIRLS